MKSSKIEILKASNQCKTVHFLKILQVSVCLPFTLKDHNMFSINPMNFGIVNDSKWKPRLIRYTKSAIF